MRRFRFSVTHLLLITSTLAAILAIALASNDSTDRLRDMEQRLSLAEKLLSEVAMPRYPNGRVVVKMPDGRQGGMPLLQSSGTKLDAPSRRIRANWQGPESWGKAASGGYFWRYIGSEGDRDIYEFVVVLGQPLPAKPDERTSAAQVCYVSFRNTPVEVISQDGFSIAIAP